MNIVTVVEGGLMAAGFAYLFVVIAWYLEEKQNDDINSLFSAGVVLHSKRELVTVCAWHTKKGWGDVGHEGEALVKDGVLLNGELVWPEPWSKERHYVAKSSRAYQNASHGLCPECFLRYTGVSA